jgi:alpha-glucuronidase
MQKCWDSLQPASSPKPGDIDPERWQQVKMLLGIQQQDAVWWRNACLLYFQTFSRQPLPAGAEQPDHTLAYYENLQLYYAPGTANSGVPQKTNP